MFFLGSLLHEEVMTTGLASNGNIERRDVSEIPQARSILTFALCFLATVIEGFDIQAAGVAAPMLIPEFKLSPGQVGIFFSAATTGLAIGAIAGGRLADIWGRKNTLMGALFVFGVASLAMAVAGDFFSLLTLRAMTGLGMGAALPTLIAIAAEAAPKGRTSSSIAFVYAGMPIGGALAALFSINGWHGDWRAVFVAGGIAPLIMVVLVAFRLELPKRQNAFHSRNQTTPGLASILSRDRALLTVSLWASFFCTLLALYLLLNWLPALLVSAGLSKSTAGFVQVLFNLAGAAGSLLMGNAVERVGIRPVVIVNYVLLALSLLLLPFVASPGISLFTLVAVVGATLMGAQALLYGIAPNAYPGSIRATAIGAAVAAGRLGSVVGPALAGLLMTLQIGPTKLFQLLAPVCIVGGLLAFVVVSQGSKRFNLDASND